MAVLKLGGKHHLHFQNLQTVIDEMVQIDLDVNDGNTSGYYGGMLKKIICNNVCFNMDAKKPELIGECNIDLMVDRHLGENNDKIIIIQNVTKFPQSNTIVGVLTIELKTNTRCFMIDKSITQDNQSKAK